MSGSYYDVAQICLNGHAINSMAQRNPQRNQNFCAECGAQTITSCKNCNAPIRGKYHVPGVTSFGTYTPPSFCYQCGTPYPWTEEKISAAKELADMMDYLTEPEVEALKKSLDDIVRDTPRTPVASQRFKQLVGKGSPEIAQSFKQILIEVVSEGAKKLIWPS